MKVIILENIRSVLNVGSIFRTADTIGIDKMYLCGITPTPVDRFGRVRSDLHKSALGAEQNVSWEYKKDTKELVDELKGESFQIVVVEQDKKSIDYKNVVVSEKVAIVLGNETEGVSKEVIDSADSVAEIKMNGEKESLNVGVTAGIVLYRFFDK